MRDGHMGERHVNGMGVQIRGKRFEMREQKRMFRHVSKWIVMRGENRQ
jgi:hypothetical protein